MIRASFCNIVRYLLYTTSKCPKMFRNKKNCYVKDHTKKVKKSTFCIYIQLHVCYNNILNCSILLHVHWLMSGAASPDWAENHGLGYFCSCRVIKILEFWATRKNRWVDLWEKVLSGFVQKLLGGFVGSLFMPPKPFLGVNRKYCNS